MNDWISLAAIAGLVVAQGGYLTVRMDRMEDRLTGRIARLEDAYLRHLEQHAR